MLGHESGRRSGRLRFPNHSDAAVPKIEGDEVEDESNCGGSQVRTLNALTPGPLD